MTTLMPPQRVQQDAERRSAARACIAIPVVVLAAAYAWLALDHGTLALWNITVHESGRYTLGRTILYFGHFLREAPVAITYALFLLSASGAASPAGNPTAVVFRVPALAWLLAAILLLVTAFLLAGALSGWPSALQDLLQYRTRDDSAGYGTHWRYHWLSTLWFGAAMTAAPSLLRRLGIRPLLQRHARWTYAAWACFAGLTLVFGISGDVFLDSRYAGHQAREILTHATVTLPLGIGLLLSASSSRVPGARSSRETGAAIGVAVAIVVALHLAVVALVGGVMEHGQSDQGLGAMVAAHYFEHTLDYLLVLLLLSGGLGLNRTHRRDR